MREEIKSVIKYYFCGVVAVGIIFSVFYVVDLYLLKFISYSFPLGYILLLLCILFFTPVVVGIVRILLKRYMFDNNELSFNFWYYGLMLVAVYWTFKTLLTYTPVPSFAYVVVSFLVLPFIFGILVRYL